MGNILIKEPRQLTLTLTLVHFNFFQSWNPSRDQPYGATLRWFNILLVPEAESGNVVIEYLIYFILF